MSSKIARSLRNMSHLRQVYAAITKMMHSIDFLDRLDTNVDLFAFKDGVLHLPTKQFRKGQPQDMLSVYAFYNFPTTDATKREELQLFLSQIKPQDDERDYLMDQFSQCLSGRVRKHCLPSNWCTSSRVHLPAMERVHCSHCFNGLSVDIFALWLLHTWLKRAHRPTTPTQSY